MTQTDVSTESTFAELELPESCPACSGPMAVRVTGDEGWAICAPCGAWARFEVEDGDKSLSLSLLLDAEA